MQYWLIKSEPFEYGYHHLEADGKTAWEGVRNYQARNNLRSMKMGDLALFYHSREGLEVVGIAKVVKEAYPDTTAEKGDWSAVDFAPFKKLKNPVSLKAIKDNPKLQNLLLVRNGRLSVMPVEKDEYDEILEMSNRK